MKRKKFILFEIKILFISFFFVLFHNIIVVLFTNFEFLKTDIITIRFKTDS